MGLLPRLVVLAVALVCVSCKTQPLPSYITACYRNDPNLNECASKNGQAALPMLVKGDRKYRIPRLDPLEIDEMVIGRGNGSVSIDLIAKNVKIFGFGDTKIKSTNIDLEQKIITLKLFAASLPVIGDYTINGKVLILPITGHGFFNITLDNTDFMYVLKYKLIKKADGLDYVALYDYKMTGKPSRTHFRLDNLFNGNKALSDSMNQVLNENWQVVTDELSPPLLEGVGQILLQVATNALRDIPYDVFLPVKP